MANRTPTEDAANEARPITAIALDARVDMVAAAARLPWSGTRPFPYAWVYDLEGLGRVFLFEFGAIVQDGVERIDDRLRAEIEQGLGRKCLPETVETYFVATGGSPSDDTPRVGWDRVVIPERSPDLVAAVALLLAQSAALERYELAVDHLLEETLDLSRVLASSGRLPQSTKRLIERVGRLTQDRLELARWFYLVDRPEETWEVRRVARLYDALFANLELRQRHEAMLHKLGAAERATQNAIDMWHGRRSNALEWAIVFLIIVEIVFGVLERL